MARISSVSVALTALVGVYSLATPATAQTTHYVDTNAAGPAHDGSSWCNAYPYLQDALPASIASDTILVADGILQPDDDTVRPAMSFGKERTT